MQVTVHLFAGLRDIVGGDITERFDADSISVSALRERLAESHEKLKPYLSGVAIAVNEDYILNDDAELKDGDTVALIPPIAGGAVQPFLVTELPLDTMALRELVMTPASGAAVLFEGAVRDHHEGQPTPIRLCLAVFLHPEPRWASHRVVPIMVFLPIPSIEWLGDEEGVDTGRLQREQ